MDLQFYGANCLVINYKNTRMVVDDNLQSLGKKTILKTGDVALFTTQHDQKIEKEVKILIDCPGDYEVDDISIKGIQARSHMDEKGKENAVIYRISAAEINLVVIGHIYPEISEDLIEAIGMCDVLVVPVGGNGYTLDPQGALKVVKEIEPKLVVPTHYDDKSLNFEVPQTTLAEALKEMGMEPRETVAKLKIKPLDLSDVTQMVVLETV